MELQLRDGAITHWRGERTQQAIADRAGIARSTLNRIERGRMMSPTFNMVNRIARALGVDANLLIAFERPQQRRR